MIKLSEAEWKVMTLLWQNAPQTMMQLTNHFKDSTGWSKHTVMTFLRRMEEKEAIYHVDGERAKLYYPEIGRDEAVLQETEEFLEKVFDGRMGLMLNTMVEKRAVSREEIAEMYEILRRAEEENRLREEGGRYGGDFDERDAADRCDSAFAVFNQGKDQHEISICPLEHSCFTAASAVVFWQQHIQCFKSGTGVAGAQCGGSGSGGDFKD